MADLAQCWYIQHLINDRMDGNHCSYTGSDGWQPSFKWLATIVRIRAPMVGNHRSNGLTLSSNPLPYSDRDVPKRWRRNESIKLFKLYCGILLRVGHLSSVLGRSQYHALRVTTHALPLLEQHKIEYMTSRRAKISRVLLLRKVIITWFHYSSAKLLSHVY